MTSNVPQRSPPGPIIMVPYCANSSHKEFINHGEFVILLCLFVSLPPCHIRQYHTPDNNNEATHSSCMHRTIIILAVIVIPGVSLYVPRRCLSPSQMNNNTNLNINRVPPPLTPRCQKGFGMEKKV